MHPLMDWYEIRFRLQLWFMQSWLAGLLAWLRFLGVDKSKWSADARDKTAAVLQVADFGKFRGTEDDSGNPMSTAEIGVQVTTVIERTRALIETNEELKDGVPVFAGSQVPIDFVLAAVDAGIAWPRIVASCPWLTVSHIDAARHYLRAQKDLPLTAEHANIQSEEDFFKEVAKDIEDMRTGKRTAPITTVAFNSLEAFVEHAADAFMRQQHDELVLQAAQRARAERCQSIFVIALVACALCCFAVGTLATLYLT